METILVTGGSGLIGNGILDITNDYLQYNFVFMSSSLCDLRDYDKTLEYVSRINPAHVIHLAANVGGLYKNLNNKVEMFEDNTAINNNIVKACHQVGVQNMVCCLSTCIFPDKTSYPINETMLHNGEPHQSNYPYAYSKRMLEVLCRAYNEQYDRNYKCVIPTNVYGPYDNFNLQDSHVIPGLIHKCYLAKKNNKPFVICGTGSPLRQFIYSTDLAKLILWTLFQYEETTPIILSGSPEDEVSIKEVATLIAKQFDYSDNMQFDSSFADGQYKKTADNSKLLSFIQQPDSISLDKGLQKTISWFSDKYHYVRK
jgi:GDP-L-fucose synthase